ncbi:hypothetical protein BDL97_15G024300 [Sphagnum fallax]|nr:hypothetical protein BDL97_15G024300 [Sphagnum fallax]
MKDSTSLTPATSSGSSGRGLSRWSTASSSSASSLPDDHEACGRFSNISSSSNGSSYSMHASRVLWVAGMNGGPDHDAHGLKIIFRQIIGPGDHLVALVLFDRIPSELGITFKFTPGGFRTAGDQKQLHWLTEKLLYWRNQLEGVAAYCNQKNIMLELRLCAGPSLGEMAVREALHLQATAIILDRADGQGSAVKNVGRLLSKKTKARVAIMHRRSWSWPWSRKVESSMQTQVDSTRHDTTDDMLLTSDPKKQELIDEIIPGLDCTCLEAKDPYYLLLIIVLAAASNTLTP